MMQLFEQLAKLDMTQLEIDHQIKEKETELDHLRGTSSEIQRKKWSIHHQIREAKAQIQQQMQNQGEGAGQTPKEHSPKMPEEPPKKEGDEKGDGEGPRSADPESKKPIPETPNSSPSPSVKPHKPE